MKTLTCNPPVGDPTSGAARFSEETFRIMADCSPVLLWLSRADSLCTFFNKSWLEFTGKSLEEEWGVGWADGLHPEDFRPTMDVYEAAFNAREPFEMKYRLRRHDGEYRWLLDRGRPLFNGNEFRGFIGSCVDISELLETQKALENQIEKQRQTEAELRFKNSELEKFAYLASHDLQAPLRAITSFSELVIESVDFAKNPEAELYLKHIIHGSREMKKLIDDLLAYSRVGSDLPEAEDINLEELISTVLVTQAIPKEQVLLKVSAMPIVSGYRTLLKQVFANLIENARKFRKPGTVASVQVLARDLGKDWEISVKDDGRGIHQKNLSRVFLVFQRCHSSPEIEGSGIGLATVKKVVELHHGQVGVESDIDKGSRFFFTLPNRGVVEGV